ncbi:MAG TPA: hypothetical protein VGC95_01045, partial [Chitinophagaceae bacterium]
AAEHLDQPINTPAPGFSALNYQLVAYYKTSAWMKGIRESIGEPLFDSAMHAYFLQWQFRHPGPADLRRSFEDVTGKNLAKEFALLDTTGLLPSDARSGTHVAFFPNPNYLKHSLDNHYRNFLTVGPAVGFNAYDKFMLGALFTNAKLPLNRFKFFIAPMYGFGSKTFAGLGRLNFTLYPSGFVRKVDLFVSASTFTQDEYKDSTHDFNLSFRKIAPGIRVTLRQHDLRQSVHRFIQWKTYLVNEDGLNFSRDTVGTPPVVVSSLKKISEHRTVNQLLLVSENHRALYPYRGELRFEQGDKFVRASFNGNYFFNYPSTGGMDVRFFAGKFIYTSSKTISNQFATDRYHLSLSGPGGSEDYTYSDYFIGRNKFDGLGSQQIMIRDGGFRIRTNLLSSPVGRSDDWLIATNLTSSVPSSINPLNILPLKIPLKVFLDIGTYSDAWKKGFEGDRFLFNAGLQVSLLRNTMNVYVPLVYSSIFRDYVKSILEKKDRFFKKISFSIDLATFSLKKIDKNLTF